jgi:hypothetical protein
MKPDPKSLDESYRKLKELEASWFKPDPTFRSIGDDLSGHEAAMITFGVKAAVEQDSEAKKPAH